MDDRTEYSKSFSCSSINRSRTVKCQSYYRSKGSTWRLLTIRDFKPCDASFTGIWTPWNFFFLFKQKVWFPTYWYMILIGFFLTTWLTLYLKSDSFDFTSKEMMSHTVSCVKDVCQIIYGTGFAETFYVDHSRRRIFLSDASISGIVSYV